MRTCSAARCQLDTFGVQSRSTEYRTPHDLGKLIAADDPKFSERELRVSRKWRFASDTSGAPPYCILPEPMSGPALHGSLSTLKPPQLSSGQNGNTTFGGSLLLEERNHGRYIDSLSASFPRHCSEQPNARRPHENLHRRELEWCQPRDALCYTGRRMLKGSGKRFSHFSHRFSGHSHPFLHQASFRVIALYPPTKL